MLYMLFLFYTMLTQVQNKAPVLHFPQQTTHTRKVDVADVTEAWGIWRDFYHSCKQLQMEWRPSLSFKVPQPFLQPELQSPTMLVSFLALSSWPLPFSLLFLLSSQEEYKGITDFLVQSNLAVSRAKTNSKT